MNKLKLLRKSLRKQVRLTKVYIKLSDKRQEIVDRLIQNKNELLLCLKTLNKFLDKLPDHEIDRLLAMPKFKRRVVAVMKKYLG